MTELTENNIKLFTMAAELMFGLVSQKRKEDFLLEYQREDFIVKRNE